MGCGNSNPKKVDHNQNQLSSQEKEDEYFSRQTAVYGVENQCKIRKLNIFLYGVFGVGIEIAKNLILSGVNQLVIYDNKICDKNDQNVNFCIRDNHIKNKNSRADASLETLQQLSLYCQIKVHKEEINNEFLSQFNVVVFTDFYDKQKLIEYNNFCRKNNIGFILSANLGLYGFLFVDFGDKHLVQDIDGEQIKQASISSISQDKQAQITVEDDKKLKFQNGDTVQFQEVQGMTELNGKQFQIEIKSAYKFTIKQDTTKFTPYKSNGIVYQVKVPQQITFKSLQEILENPQKDDFMLFDSTQTSQSQDLHIILNGLFEYYQENKKLPQFLNEDNAKQVIGIINKIQGKYKNLNANQINESLIKNIVLYSQANIIPICYIWGALVSQEVIKYIGLYKPIKQIIHCEMLDILCPQQNLQVLNDNYQLSVLGKVFFNKLGNQNIFLVGAGSLGCEYLKNISLLLNNCSLDGQIFITDFDKVNFSNLNTQFLYTNQFLGKSKSEVIANQIKLINKQIKIKNFNKSFNLKNQQIFDDLFWDNLNIVITSVDNTQTRALIDAQCVWFGKPLFDSGIQESKCHTQVIVPKQTQCYQDSHDISEESAPLCVLSNFPHIIQHTVQWSSDQFQVFFVEGIEEISKFVKNGQQHIQNLKNEFQDKSGFLKQKLLNLQTYATVLLQPNYEQCINIAFKLFYQNFYDQIIQLLQGFPIDHKNEDGKPFWSGHKRLPQALELNYEDQLHLDFILSVSNIIAYSFDIKGQLPKDKIAKYLGQNKETLQKLFQVEKKNIDDDQINLNLIAELQKLKIKHSQKVYLLQLENDEQQELQQNFIYTTSNLRARNYKIEEASKQKIKMISNKTVPSTAIMASLGASLNIIQIIKYLKNQIQQKNVYQQKNSFINLAIPLYLFADTLAPIAQKDKEYDEIVLGPVKAIPPGFTNWDKIEINGPMKLSQLIDNFKDQYKVKLSIISVGKLCIYNVYGGQQQQDLLNQDILELYQKLQKQKVPASKAFLEIIVNGETLDDSTDCNMPVIKYRIK
ncbi:ubiquitin-activating enzyme e1, putative [Ichthyophthirius multifiliis]|uniref:Ubiquitin-activating enzyme e1, putative n=1 Tax=Ichthyophthirius multifiliis TaxID=5932 RepID=G0R5S9_ICHMU|nr:ubiquitin-activating enzyme e1, putative [Ichthyophthirius multifiliis]EGR27187.1 ubiquitin-activating enzyme e1, putative [Ichthyophthirius multifiliis]|eukprot:XP_004024071.1 ubiquitin-activating enzyme e1, putative [Ichthyophthirius multifiliis]